MERDSANMYVLEAIIISMILLGAAYAVSTLQDSSIQNARPRAELDRVVSDALTVLAGLDDGNGTKLLDLYVLEALHCAVDEVPSPTDCQGRRSNNLSVKLDSYLPLGAGYAIGIGNGATTREIYASTLPEGEAVSASYVFEPEWNTSFVFTEFSCYPAGVDINATIIPIDRGRVTWARWGNVTVTTETEGQRAFETNWWNVTIPGGARPVAGILRANVTSNATLPGLTSYQQCAHGGLTAQLRDALKLTEFEAAAASVPVNSAVAFDADLGALQGVSGVTIVSSTVTIYEPLPTYSNGPDTWIRAGEPITLDAAGTGTWTAPVDAFYGTHPALLRVTVTVGTDTFELRRATLIDVALPTGEVPVHPPYRASIRAWLADWG